MDTLSHRNNRPRDVLFIFQFTQDKGLIRYVQVGLNERNFARASCTGEISRVITGEIHVLDWVE